MISSVRYSKIPYVLVVIDGGIGNTGVLSYRRRREAIADA
jgi:hypothetical protein